MARLLAVLLLCAAAAAVRCTAAAEETFVEEALVSPLTDGLVLVHLQFTFSATYQRHYTLLPKAVGQLAAAIPFSKFELSLSQGRWHYSRWQAPPLPAKPAGAELRAWFAPRLAASVEQLWGSLSHSLGGLFCASLSFVARPEATARQAIDCAPQCDTHTAAAAADMADPRGHNTSCAQYSCAGAPAAARELVLVATLPQEASCTENLTPWLKLLPCRDAAGLGQLLSNREVVFGADHHSMQVRLQVERDAQQRPLRTTLSQSMTLVLRPPSGSSWAASRGPGARDIQLAQLLGVAAAGACPAAQHSRLYLQLGEHQGQLWPLQVPGWETEAAAGQSGGCQGTPDGASSCSAGSHSRPESSTQPEGAAAPDERARATAANDDAAADARRRPAAWVTPSFTLSPAPDAAIALASGPHQQAGGKSSNSTGSASRALYVFDVSPRRSGKGATQTFNLTWAQPVAAGEAGGPAALLSVTRFITGTGALHGGMVLQLEAAGGLAPAAAAGRAPASDNGDWVTVCIFQTVPWYVRLWLHTLQLSIDGQPVRLADHLLLRHIQPADDRAVPLVLELCLAVPSAAQRLSLTAHFTKGFLAMAEHPPDAYRGFDVPAAIISIAAGNASRAAVEQPRRRRQLGLASLANHCGGGSSWHISTADGLAADSVQQLRYPTPLLTQLMQQEQQQVYSPIVVVPLAVPDFSMPYNVVCLTSTVMAVFFGAVLNALLQRPGREERVEAAGPGAWSQLRRRKRLKLAAVLAVFAVLGLYLDPTLHEELLAAVLKATAPPAS